ncbi:hypothetical protein CesoFtcFv8_014298 [Champsocephalus esox]|uniref:Uncharacterized protein n=1 Tax=Champsocephalus esox TaxID=159716 RepID=A0AAN8BST0_9TELE|nr:hypothetical protein CesoFtcFv8_014298 [Champsocephalus esox]
MQPEGKRLDAGAADRPTSHWLLPLLEMNQWTPMIAQSNCNKDTPKESLQIPEGSPRGMSVDCHASLHHPSASSPRTSPTPGWPGTVMAFKAGKDERVCSIDHTRRSAIPQPPLSRCLSRRTQ